MELEVVEMAVHLGLKSITASNQLSEAQLWIIEKALEAPLPDGWTVRTAPHPGQQHGGRCCSVCISLADYLGYNWLHQPHPCSCRCPFR